jgi:collagen type VII alpha
MRFKVLYLFLLALLWQGTAFANTVVTATSIVDSSNTPISSAQLCFSPTNIVAQPTGFKVGTTSVVATPVCRLVTNGVLATGTSVVPSASGILYHIFLTPVNNTTTILKDYGYTPITGTTWSLDTFNPNNSVVAPVSTVSYGTLTPLSPGAGGWCNLTGSSPSYKLNCGIPVGTAGAQGPTGAQGPPVTFRGGFSTVTTYAAGDAVKYSDGSSYVSLQSSNLNHQPDTFPTYWAVLAQAGNTGPQGIQGDTGPQGPTGSTGSQGPAGAGFINGLASDGTNGIAVTGAVAASTVATTSVSSSTVAATTVNATTVTAGTVTPAWLAKIGYVSSSTWGRGSR